MLYDIDELEKSEATLPSIYKILKECKKDYFKPPKPSKDSSKPTETFKNKVIEKLEKIGETDGFILAMVMLFNKFGQQDIVDIKQSCFDKECWKAYYMVSCLNELKVRITEISRENYEKFMESWCDSKDHPEAEGYIKEDRAEDYEYVFYPFF